MANQTRNRTISGKLTPAKAKRRVDVTPPIAPSIGATMMQGGRPNRGAVPSTVGMAMQQPGRTAKTNISPGKVPSLRGTMHQ